MVGDSRYGLFLVRAGRYCELDTFILLILCYYLRCGVDLWWGRWGEQRAKIMRLA